MTHAKPWHRPRNIVLLVLAFIGTVIGLTMYRSVTARPGSAVDYHERLGALVESHQPEGSRGSGPAAPNAYAYLLDAIAVLREVETAVAEEAGGEDAAPEDWPAKVGWPHDFGLLYEAHAESPAHARAEATTVRVVEILRERGLPERLARAAATPRAVRPVEEGGRLIDILLPDLGKTRHLARYGAARMRLAADAGDWEEYGAAFEGVLACGRVTAHQPLLIDRLVAMSCVSLAVGQARRDVLEGSVDGAACRRLLAALDRQTGYPPIGFAFEGERIGALDVVQWTHTDDGNGDGRLILSTVNAMPQGGPVAGGGEGAGLGRLVNVAGYFLPGKAATTARVNEFYDGIIALSRLPVSRRGSAVFDPVAFVDALPRGYVVLRMMLPAFDRVLRHEAQVAAEIAGVRTMLALAAYRAERGEYPEGLASLVPEYLSAVPTDPATGGPIGFRLIDPDEDEFGRGYVLFTALPTDPDHETGGTAKAGSVETSEQILNAPPAGSTPGE